MNSFSLGGAFYVWDLFLSNAKAYENNTVFLYFCNLKSCPLTLQQHLTVNLAHSPPAPGLTLR